MATDENQSADLPSHFPMLETPTCTHYQCAQKNCIIKNAKPTSPKVIHTRRSGRSQEGLESWLATAPSPMSPLSHERRGGLGAVGDPIKAMCHQRRVLPPGPDTPASNWSP